MSIGTFESAEKALAFLGKTDEQHGSLKAHHQAMDNYRKMVRAQQYLEAEGTSAAERNSKAEASAAYKQAVDDHENAMAEFYILDNKRNSAVLAIEVYRSANSSLKKGSIA